MRNNKGKNIISFCVIFMAMLVVGIMAFGERTVLAASQSETLVNYALSQVGTTERRPNSDSVIYNDWYGMGNVRWCHVFVSYCAAKSGIPTSIIPKTASCQEGVNWFKKRNRYHTRSSGYVPKRGDIIYMATTSGSSTAHHVGIVYAVDSCKVYYVDGNNTITTPHSVRKTPKDRTDSRILGYGNPAYTDADIKYSIDNVKIKSINSNQVTLSWTTTNLPKSCMVVQAGNRTWKTDYAIGSGFTATFNRSSVTNCPQEVNILIYAYTKDNKHETVHRVTYGTNRVGVLVFPSAPKRVEKFYSESVPVNMLSHGDFRGWITSDTSITNVYVTVNGKKLTAKLTSRADVSKAYPNYKYAKGYSLRISPYYVNDGNNTYSVDAVLSNGKYVNIKSGKFKAEKVACIYDDTYFRNKYSKNSYINSLKSAEDREKFFYDNLNNKFSDGYKMEYLTASIAVDLQYYNDANSDIKRQNYNGYQIYDHLIHYGLKQREYRATSPFVSLYYLHAAYGDLKSMSPEALMNWVMMYGVRRDQRLLSSTNESRAFNRFYKISSYASKNRDLIAAFGTPSWAVSNYNKYWEHLWNYGVSENRIISNYFNVGVYRRNAGLSSKATPWDVFHHYYTQGYARGIRTR